MLSQEDCCESEVSLGYVIPGQPGLQTLSQKAKVGRMGVEAWNKNFNRSVWIRTKPFVFCKKIEQSWMEVEVKN